MIRIALQAGLPHSKGHSVPRLSGMAVAPLPELTTKGVEL